MPGCAEEFGSRASGVGERILLGAKGNPLTGKRVHMVGYEDAEMTTWIKTRTLTSPTMGEAGASAKGIWI